MKAILTAAWAAVLFVSSLPASAALPQYDTRSVKVDYSNLDLTKAQGVSTFQHRISGAVREVCGGPAFGFQEQMQQRACASSANGAARNDADKAIANARQQPWTGTAEGNAGTRTFDKSFLTGQGQSRTIQRTIPRR